MKKQKTLKEFYKESLFFIKESKRHIFYIISIFLFFSIIGYFIPLPPEIEKIIQEKLKEILLAFQGLGLFGTTWNIFSNNIFVSFISILFGVLFGIFPVMTSISNGFLIGYVANHAVSAEGIFVLWKLLPHGIFELPAILISLGIGLKLGATMIFNSDKLKIESKKAFFVFLLVVTPLLILAAGIEGSLVYFFK